MKFWLVLLSLTTVFVAGSVALAGNDEPTTTRLNPNAPKPVPSEASTRNGLIAASSKGALVLVDPASGRVTKVAGTAGMDKPAWSPDGRLLAVEKTAGGSTSVYKIRLDGTQAQLVMKDASAPAWSEDGTQIYVERGACTALSGCDESDEDATVYTVRPDGSDAHELGDDDVYDPVQAGWPPATHALSFLEDQGSSAPTELDSSQATWSPDGFELAFADPSTGLWVVSVDGGNPKLVASGSYSSPSWGTAASSRVGRSARR